jgi:hypothetical protein
MPFSLLGFITKPQLKVAKLRFNILVNKDKQIEALNKKIRELNMHLEKAKAERDRVIKRARHDKP